MTAVLEAAAASDVFISDVLGSAPVASLDPTPAPRVSSAQLVDRVTLLDLTCKAMSVRRRANVLDIETDADKARLSLSKKILRCPEMDEIKSHIQTVRRWVDDHRIPTGDQFRPGMYLMPYATLTEIDDYLRAAQDRLADLVEDLAGVYEQTIESDKDALKSQFNEANYPPKDELQDHFSIRYAFAEMLPPEHMKRIDRAMWEREAEKLRRRMEEAAEESRYLIMEQAKELAENVIERLTPDPATGKPRTFRESLLGNWTEFLDGFAYKNITDDAQLAALMDEVREKVSGKQITDLRESAAVRDEVRNLFAGVTAKLDDMIVRRPSRKIDLTDEDEE